MHKNSQNTSKVKSKIRIIHIFAPQIIKTDAANFRDLVQRLTGKPTEDGNDEKNRKKSRAEQRDIKGMEAAEGFREKIKGEDEIWRDANTYTGGGFLGAFDDQAGFFLHEPSDSFPFIEGATTTTTNQGLIQ